MAIIEQEVFNITKELLPIAGAPDITTSRAMEVTFQTALLWHSRIVPRRAMSLGTGDGSAVYDLPDDLIRIRQIEYEYGGTPPTYLDATQWTLHLGTAGEEIIFDSAIGTATTFGIHYSGTWGTASLTSGQDEYKIALLQCAVLCLRQAARMGERTSSVYDADTVRHNSYVPSWIQLKDQYINLYSQAVGVSSKIVSSGAPPPAWGFGEVATKNRFQRWWWDTE